MVGKLRSLRCTDGHELTTGNWLIRACLPQLLNTSAHVATLAGWKLNTRASRLQVEPPKADKMFWNQRARASLRVLLNARLSRGSWMFLREHFSHRVKKILCDKRLADEGRLRRAYRCGALQLCLPDCRTAFDGKPLRTFPGKFYGLFAALRAPASFLTATSSSIGV